MHANWSLILNALLLVGVMVAIGRLMKARKQGLDSERYQPGLGAMERNAYDAQGYGDDIIAVRKISTNPSLDSEAPSFKKTTAKSMQPRLMPHDDEEEIVVRRREPRVAPKIMDLDFVDEEIREETGPTVMMFLVAKENRQFAGYELLQTVLAAGLRFGEGGLFHRHQYSNSDGSVLCSLAAATATGVFDLQNIGAFSVRGLCLYMHASNNQDIDGERFSVMLETARQLSEGLDAHLLDDQRRHLTEERMARYYSLLKLDQEQFELESA